MSASSTTEPRVSYFGPENTNTHAAALEAYGSRATFIPELTKTAVFEAVESGRSDAGVVPIENSTEGVVRETVDCLISKRPKIIREFERNIGHFLMARPGARPEEATRILSHPQALAQCRRWLDEHYPTLVRESAVSTARAAQLALADETILAVASELAATNLGLTIVARDIADRADNATRFICIANSETEPTGNDKTSLLFTAPHERGALLRVLSVFDAADVNLTRIESRPLPGKRWEYAFVADVEGHQTLPPLRGALETLKAEGCLTKVLGSYPSAGKPPGLVD